MATTKLYDQLKGMRTQTVRVALQPGTRRTNPQTGETLTDPMIGTTPIDFDIHSISANAIIEADALVTAKAPQLFQEEPNSKGVGMVRVMKGYDHDDPDYIAKRQAQIPRRDAAICLFGCPALADSVPGTTLKDKIDKLLEDIPGVLLDWLCQEIETISILTAVGEEAVSSFLAEGSVAGTGTSSPDTNNRSRAGGKNKRSTGSTARTSTTKSAKRRTTGG